MEKKKPFVSALRVHSGIEQPPQINEPAIEKLSLNRPPLLSAEEYVQGIRTGNRTLLSKAITLVESALPAHAKLAQEIIAGCLRLETEPKGEGGEPGPASIRIGITGVPGVGKSTFIEALGKHVTGLGHRLAVLAIDPSSARTKGSILGDKTRMESLAVDPLAFIRPSPSSGSLGGVARKTRETILLCEAAGFDVIFVETVGVGQSEITVKSMVDFFLLLMLAGAGDELQGIKRGIIEMADAIVINKADGDNIRKAGLAAREYASALHLFPPSESGWIPVVDTCSAKTGEGIFRVWQIIRDFRLLMVQKGYFQHNRMLQNKELFYQEIGERLKDDFFTNPANKKQIRKLDESVTKGIISPYLAVNQLFQT